MADPTGNTETPQASWEFVAPAVHQLRTPLTAILSFTELMLRGVGGEDRQREWLGHIRGQSLRMRAILNSMLSLSELQAGGIQLKIRPVDVARVCADVVRVAAAVAPGHDIRAVITGDSRWVMGDPARIEEVLWNLVDNAVKYSPDGGSVVIETGSGVGGAVAVRVRDSGIGIHPDQVGRLFTPFHRADRTSGIQGTGLGLYVVKALVNVQGGSVSVESAPGQGSVFSFTLPAAGSGSVDAPDWSNTRTVYVPAPASGAPNVSDADASFAGYISRELRAPLTPLLAYAELCADPMAPAGRRHEWIRRIRWLALRMSGIADVILVASRLDSGRLSVDPEPVDVHSLLQSLSENASLCEGARVCVESEPGTVVAVGDRRRLQEALSALVDVALRRPSADREVRLSAGCRDGQVLIALAFQPDCEGDLQAGNLAELQLRVARRLVEMQAGDLDVAADDRGRQVYQVRLPEDTGRRSQ